MQASPLQRKVMSEQCLIRMPFCRYNLQINIMVLSTVCGDGHVTACIHIVEGGRCFPSIGSEVHAVYYVLNIT